MEERIQAAASFIKKSGEGSGIALTGAGVSAESGIATYRDKGGLWDRFQEGASGGMLGVLASHPEEAPQILRDYFRKMEESRPNPGHVALVQLEEMGLLRAVITQNVDDLHRQAGTSLLYELHGNVYRLRCMACGKRRRLDRNSAFELAEDVAQKIKHFSLAAIAEILPRCECGGAMRPDFVGFGEPVHHLQEAMAELQKTEWLIIAGTSGVVHPAASFPAWARERGAATIEVNNKESEFTRKVDYFLEGPAGEVLPRLVEAVKNMDGALAAEV